MSERWLKLELQKLKDSTTKLYKEVEMIRYYYDDRERKMRDKIAAIESNADKVLAAFEGARETAERDAKREVRKLEQKLALAEKKLEKLTGTQAVTAENKEDIERASTFAIYDSILFAIENWSSDGDTAPDFTIACQSVLFPVIYERVMRGQADYYLPEVPPSALEVVKRGREYVQHFRGSCEASLADPEAWSEHVGAVQQWWVRDALPLLYGARADEWDEDKPLSLTEILEWRDQPASRALHFPLIFDGMELVEKHRDQIRENTGLPEFTRQTAQTRLQP